MTRSFAHDILNYSVRKILSPNLNKVKYANIQPLNSIKKITFTINPFETCEFFFHTFSQSILSIYF